jgi:hypothetical protein
MLLKNLAKYSIEKKSMSKITGGGGGRVTCNNGESFSADASSNEAVRRGGERWCRSRGGVSTFLYIEDLQQGG